MQLDWLYIEAEVAEDNGRSIQVCRVHGCKLGIGSVLSLYVVLDSEATLGPTASDTSETGASLGLSGRGSVSSGLNVSTDLVFRLVFPSSLLKQT